MTGAMFVVVFFLSYAFVNYEFKEPDYDHKFDVGDCFTVNVTGTKGVVLQRWKYQPKLEVRVGDQETKTVFELEITHTEC